MKSAIVNTNYTNSSLYCYYSKERIVIGEKYIVVFERYNEDWIEKIYKAEYWRMLNE